MLMQKPDATVESRDLIRRLRTQPDREAHTSGLLPESVLWRAWCELRRRGESSADELFMKSLQHLLRRRSLGGTELPSVDPDPEEHKLAGDPYLGELWKAYKRCICNARTGPATQLLHDIETQIVRV